MSSYRSTPHETEKMPPGIPYIISNEAAERFSFYGMKAILGVFLVGYLGVLGGENKSEAEATAWVSFFNSAVYATPIIGAILADAFFGKYRIIITLSIVYCLGHLCLAFAGIGGVVELWFLAGLGLIAIGAGGIKPCVTAHVGDQFGRSNQHLLTKIFNIFYFSINFGAVVSNLLIPVVLHRYGPHWAFGIPGALMALATFWFWMGRRKFVHVPAGGKRFLGELLSREGTSAILKLLPLVAFVAVFWCLFDQTASTFVFQAEKMNRNFFGHEVLPSQVQALNPFLILILIPIFTFALYPAIERHVRLTPLRKIGAGLFIMIGSFAVVAIAQEAIDRGETPHVTWQILAYVILTAAEVLVSIVALEFFYTQAPRRMKSLMLGLFLLSVFLGNFVTGAINHVIQIPAIEFEDDAHAGFDGTKGTDDDLHFFEGVIESPVSGLLGEVADRVADEYATGEALPLELADLPQDPWGNSLRYKLDHAKQARVLSAGPDGEPGTEWDLGITLQVKDADAEDRDTWLYREKERLGMLTPVDTEPSVAISRTTTAGGGVRLEDAAYFWFFTKLMVVTAVLFVPFAMLYRTRDYLQDEVAEVDEG